MRNLFRFQKSPDCNTPSSGAPRLVPNGGRISQSLSQNFLGNDSISGNSGGLIDVINGFYWTSSQLSSRQDVPAIVLKEKRLKTNSLIAQLAYYTSIASGKTGSLAGRLSNLFSNSSLGGGALGNAIGNAASGLGQAITGAVSNFGSGIMGSGLLQILTGKSSEGILSSLRGESASSDVLKAYEGLYITEDTKFVYRMPYFENVANAVSNAFANDDKILTGTFGLGAAVAGAANIAEKLAYGVTTSTNMMEPGIYIEKPQFYSFGSSGDSVTFNFPLINTGWATFEDVQRNWQLIYMLIYQNRPNRKTRELIDPPCIYEVMIPGVKYMPYAFVSNLTVSFMGSRRSYYINIPSKSGGGSSKIQTIIPDAYMVSMSLKGLIGESQNFLYHMLYENQSKINVFSNIGRGGIIGNFVEGLIGERNKNIFSDVKKSTNKTTQR